MERPSGERRPSMGATSIIGRSRDCTSRVFASGAYLRTGRGIASAAVRLLAALIGTLAIAVAGCGDEEADEPSGAGQDTREERSPPAQEPKQPAEEQPPADPDGGGFTGQAAENYEMAKVVCGSFPPRKVASDLGLSVNGDTAEELGQIAERYARGYTGSQPRSRAASTVFRTRRSQLPQIRPTATRTGLPGYLLTSKRFREFSRRGQTVVRRARNLASWDRRAPSDQISDRDGTVELDAAVVKRICEPEYGRHGRISAATVHGS